MTIRVVPPSTPLGEVICTPAERPLSALMTFGALERANCSPETLSVEYPNSRFCLFIPSPVTTTSPN